MLANAIISSLPSRERGELRELADGRACFPVVLARRDGRPLKNASTGTSSTREKLVQTARTDAVWRRVSILDLLEGNIDPLAEELPG